MAERQAVWKIAANYSKARSEAKKTREELERLDRTREDVNENSVKGDRESTASQKTNTKSVLSNLKALAARRREQREGVDTTEAATAATSQNTKATQKSTEATERQTSAFEKSIGVLARLNRERGKHAAAQRREVADTELVIRAKQRLAQAEISQQRATLALETAQQRAAAALQKHGAESAKYQERLLIQNRRTLELSASTDRYQRALSGLNGAQTSAGNGSNRLSSSLSGLDGWFSRVRRSLGLFRVALGVIKFSAILFGVSALVSGLSNLAGGAIAAVAPVLQLANAAAALPQAFTVAAGAIGTFVGAFSGLGDALKAGAEAQKSSGQAAKDNAAAQKQQADAIRGAARNVVAAERAQEDAAKRLTEARKQARQELQNYQRQLEDLALQERGAAISVEEARRRLQETLIDPRADQLAKDSARLAYDEALFQQKNLRKDAEKTRKESAEADKKGVNGSDAVQDALQAQREAAENLREAQRGLRDAQNQSATATSAAASASDKYAESMKNLSPEAQKFVKLLLSMRGELDKLRFAAQRGLLPGVGAALTELTKLTPIAERGLESFGRIMGDTINNIAKTATSDEFIPMWNRLLTSNEKILGSVGRATENLFEAIVYLMDAARPFTEWIFETVEGWTAYWKEISIAGNKTGSTAKKLQRVRDIMESLGESISNTWNTFQNLGMAGEDSSDRMLKGLEKITAGWEKWTGSIEGQNELKDWFEQSEKVMSALGYLGGKTMRGIFDLGRDNNLDVLIRQIADELGPAIYRLLDAFQGDWASDLVSALTAVVDLVAKLGEGGGLSVFYNVIEGIATVLDSFPAPVLNAIVGSLAAIAALRFVGAVTGVTSIAKGLTKMAKSRKGAQAAAAAAAGESAAEGGGSTVVATGGRGKRFKDEPKKSMRQRFRERDARMGEGGFVAVGGGAREKKAPAKRMAPAASKRRGAGIARGAGKVGGAGLAVGAVAAGLGMLPGPIGAVTEKFGGLALMLATIAPLFAGLGGILMKAGGFFITFVATVGRVLGQLVGIVSRALMIIGRALLANPWVLLIAALVAVVVLVVKYWDEIKAVVMRALTWLKDFIVKNWNIIKWFMGPMGLLIDLVVKNWDRIKQVFMRGVEILKAAFKLGWSAMKKIFTDPIEAAKIAISAIWDGIKGLFTRGKNAIMDTMGKLRDGLGTVWDKIKSIMSKPVEFVVNTVLNKGIIKNYNRLADVLPGIGPIPEIEFKGFKRGGIPSASKMNTYPGYTPGRDVGVIGISGGEAIMRPEWTRAVGTRRIEEMNRAARNGGVRGVQRKLHGDPGKAAMGFASGGVVPLPGGSLTNRHPTPYYGAWFAGDYNKAGNDYGSPIVAWKSGRVASVRSLQGSYGNHVVVNHSDGNHTLYAHMSRFGGVKPGDQVSAGQTLGYVGSTGNSTGPHLHFEIEGGKVEEVLSGGGTPGGSGGGLSLPRWARAIVDNVAGWVGDKVKSGVDNLASTFGDSKMVQLLAAVPKSMVDAFTKFVSSETSEAREQAAIGANTGMVMDASAATGSVVAQVRQVAARYGWDQGAQWNSLYELVRRESSWNPNAANPSSSARGLFQKMTSIHGPVEATAGGQAVWGLNYIKGRYGSPAAALAFHNARGYYKDGGVVPEGTGVAPVQAFARGGSVRGYGNRDTVPAMLTPGEFVINKASVNRLGVSNLDRLNRTRNKKRGLAEGTQNFADGGVVRSGTFNAHTYGHSPAKTIADLKKVLPQVDSLALQEWTNAAGSAEKFLRDSGFGLYRGPTGTAIAWRKSRFNASNFGAEDLNVQYSMPKRTSQRYAAYGLLTDKQTGQRFWQTSSHFIPPVGYYRGAVSGKLHAAIFKEQQDRLAALTRRLQASAPVINGGDFNKRNGGLIAGTASNLPGKSIDQIYTTIGAGSGARKIGGLNSDHDAVTTTYRLTNPPGGAPVSTPEEIPGAIRPVLGMQRGAKGDWVKALQFLVGQEQTGVWRPKLGKVLGQRGHNLWKPNPQPNNLMKALNAHLGVSKYPRLFTKATQAALTHALAHTFNRPHSDDSYRGDTATRDWTPLEASLISANIRNQELQEFQNALGILSGWGFTYLTDDLLSQGVDGDNTLEIAKEAAGNFGLSKQLNEALRIQKLFTDEDLSRLIKMIGLFNSSPSAPGLRDMARALGASDYDVIKLYENGITANKFTGVPASKRTRLDSDVAKWRDGTYYFNEGGSVPGAGNRDTVPAMLTPGEFVLKKKAAEALGLNNLWALNGLQKFNSGGLVMAPETRYAPSRSTVGVSAPRLQTSSGGVQYTNYYDVDINNPIAEEGSKSLTKALQRQAAFKDGTGGNTVRGN